MIAGIEILVLPVAPHYDGAANMAADFAGVCTGGEGAEYRDKNYHKGNKYR